MPPATVTTTPATGSTPSAPQPMAGPKKSWRFWLQILLPLLVVIVGLALYFLVFKGNAKTNSDKFTYGQLASYSFNKNQSGGGMTFEEPTQFKLSTGTNTSVVLIHDLPNKQLSAYIAASIAPLAAPLPASALQSYSQVLGNPANIYYAQTVKNIVSFAQGNFSHSAKQSSTIKLGNAQKFTSPNIKANAWVFNLTASDPIEKTQNTGKVVFALGSKGYYLFLVYATNLNWQGNLSTWNQVIDSIKIDQ